MADTNFESRLAAVKGNAPQEVKKQVLKKVGDSPFGKSIMSRAVLSEIDIDEYTTGDGKKKEVSKTTFELSVEHDMLNGFGNIHGGCIGFLIENFSAIALRAHNLPSSKFYHTSTGGSQSVNYIVHAPTQVEASLKIICTSLAIGGRMSTIRTEIWDTTNKRLAASGAQVLMTPSSRPAAKI